MIRGEIPIEPGASWFSPKCVEAQPFMTNCSKVKHCFGAGYESDTKLWQTKNIDHAFHRRVRQRGISFVVKRETAQNTS